MDSQQQPGSNFSFNAFDIINTASMAADGAARRDVKDRAVNIPQNPEPLQNVRLTPEEAERLRKLRALPEHVKVRFVT